jgi:hypothetical protein
MRTRCEGDGGAALIEFTVVIGLLLYLILGAVSFGVILATSHQLNEAAGESARAAALAWNDPMTGADERRATALVSLENNGIECGPGKVSCEVTIDPCIGQPAASCVTVEVVHDRAVDPLVGRIPILEGVLPDTLTANATAMVNP